MIRSLVSYFFIAIIVAFLSVTASALDPDMRIEQTASAFSEMSGESASESEADLFSRLRDLINRAFGPNISTMSRSARNDDAGLLPMPRAGRSEGMLPMMRTGRSDGLVPMARAGRSEGMVPMVRAGRSDGILPMARAGRSGVVPFPRTGRSEGILPLPRAGRSEVADGVVPMPRAGRSDGMLPMMRAGRSDGLVPMARAGRSDGMLPMMRAGRSDGLVPMARAGRSDGMLPMMRAGRSDGLVPMARAGRSDGMLPLPRAGRSVSSDPQMHARSRRSIPVVIVERGASDVNESNADARNKQGNEIMNDISEDSLDDLDMLLPEIPNDADEDENDVSGMRRFTRQLIPNPRVGRRSDPLVSVATDRPASTHRHSHHRHHFLLLPNHIHVLPPFAGIESSSSLEESGPESGYYDDPIDLQLRAMYIPRFGKRSFSAMSPMNKKGGNKGTFQPRIGRSSFQPRVGRGAEGWQTADDSDYLTLEDLMDIRSLRAFQPRIGRSAGKSETRIKEDSSMRPSGKN